MGPARVDHTNVSDRPWTGPGERLCFRERSLPRELASVFMRASEGRKASGESDEGLRQTEEQKQVRVTLLLNLQMAKEAPELP